MRVVQFNPEEILDKALEKYGSVERVMGALMLYLVKERGLSFRSAYSYALHLRYLYRDRSPLHDYKMFSRSSRSNYRSAVRWLWSLLEEG